MSADLLQKHIEERLSQGTSPQELAKLLMTAGWPEDIVRQYIHTTKPASPQKACIHAEGITKSFNSNLVLDRVNLSVVPGEILGIAGMSGSGKSTFLNTLVGFITPDAGDIAITLDRQQSVSIFKNPTLAKQLIGFSPQTSAFYQKLTVLENIYHFAQLYQLTPAQINARALFLLTLSCLIEFKNTTAQNLTRGCQKKLDIICSLIHTPAILILDEPTSELDAISAQDVWKLIHQIHKDTTIIIASRMLDELEHHSTRIAILRNKKIMEIGTPTELSSIYSPNYHIKIETYQKSYDAITKRIKKNLRPIHFTINNNQLTMITPNPEQTLTTLLESITHAQDRIRTLHISKPTLHDTFTKLLKTKQTPSSKP